MEIWQLIKKKKRYIYIWQDVVLGGLETQSFGGGWFPHNASKSIEYINPISSNGQEI